MNNHISNKNLIVLGAGESGIGAALLARQQGWNVFVSDEGKLKESYRSELTNAAIDFEEGGHTSERILQADCIVKSPGIGEKNALMQQIRNSGIEVISEIEFAFRYKGKSKIVAITGSNGKSTTTKLVYHLFKESDYNVAMVGNIGYSFARQIAVEPKEWYIIEVSSFQLDDIKTFQPEIAILLNISPDHLDRYEYDIRNYIKSKFRITENQNSKNAFIINLDDEAINQYLRTHTTNANTYYFTMNEQKLTTEGAFIKDDEMHIQVDGEETNMSIHDLAVKGKHNQYNSMAAGISASIAGIRRQKIRDSFSSFTGLEHRLEFIATVKGVDFINDSKATNVNSVWYALESMTKPTILILGGQDKGNDYGELLELVKEKVKAIVCLGIDNSPIVSFFQEVVPVIETADAIDAAKQSFALATKGDVVLLSPACASFDLFKNYEDRGQQFKDAVINL